MINLFLSLVLALSSFSPALAVARPNVLVITMDDQRWDSVNRMNNVTNRIVKQGISFANAFAGTPLCGPARASGLTGLHARNHGVIENSIPLNRQTWLKSLQDIGYKTASIGKYMHSGAKPPGIDRWVFVGTQYTDPFIFVDGKRIQHFGYTPYIVADYAIQFIRQQAIAGRPWAMFLGLQPPHTPATPAFEDRVLFASELLPRPPSFNEADISDKWFKRLPLTTDQITGLEYLHHEMVQMSQVYPAASCASWQAWSMRV